MSLVSFKAQNHRQQVGKRGALDKVDDRRTPRSLFDPLNEEFGFTLDVAASTSNRLTERYYDLEANALTQPWDGVVWCNPPYSDLRPWVEKATLEMASAEGPELVVDAPTCEPHRAGVVAGLHRARPSTRVGSRFASSAAGFGLTPPTTTTRPSRKAIGRRSAWSS